MKVCVNITLQRHHMDPDEMYREKAGREMLKNATSYFEQILEAVPLEQQLYVHILHISKTI